MKSPGKHVFVVLNHAALQRRFEQEGTLLMRPCSEPLALPTTRSLVDSGTCSLIKAIPGSPDSGIASFILCQVPFKEHYALVSYLWLFEHAPAYIETTGELSHRWFSARFANGEWEVELIDQGPL